MPYYKCRKCHHEFERIPSQNEKIECDWCGADRPIILEEEIPLEKLAKNYNQVLEIIKKVEGK